MNNTIRAVACVLGVACAALPALGQDAGVRYKPEDMKYIPTGATGTAAAVLFGDPSKEGLFAQRVKIPAGLKVPPHWHPDKSRTVVVMSGTLYFGLGETWDESKLEARPAGTFFSEAPRAPHFVWAKDGEVILHISGIGPSGTTVVGKAP